MSFILAKQSTSGIGIASANSQPRAVLPKATDVKEVSAERSRSLAEWCVYTIVDGKRLVHDAKVGGAVQFHEGLRWTTAKRLLQEASAANKRMPVLFGDATECSRLRYWGLLTKIDVQDGATSFVVESLREIRKRRTQELVLRNTRKNIAPNFIKPYAICLTPTFLNPRNRR